MYLPSRTSSELHKLSKIEIFRSALRAEMVRKLTRDLVHYKGTPTTRVHYKGCYKGTLQCSLSKYLWVSPPNIIIDVPGISRTRGPRARPIYTNNPTQGTPFLEVSLSISHYVPKNTLFVTSRVLGNSRTRGRETPKNAHPYQVRLLKKVCGILGE